VTDAAALAEWTPPTAGEEGGVENKGEDSYGDEDEDADADADADGEYERDDDQAAPVPVSRVMGLVYPDFFEHLQEYQRKGLRHPLISGRHVTQALVAVEASMRQLLEEVLLEGT
jgi:hypothetical protein